MDLIPIIGCCKKAAETYLSQQRGKNIKIPESGEIYNYVFKDGTLYKKNTESKPEKESEQKSEKYESGDVQYIFDF